jgi:hypothetical protein
MLFSVVNGRYYYDSNTFLPSAANNEYILEEYPSQIRAIPQYDSSYNGFRPITPPYYQPAVATIRPGSYDKPATSYFDTEQIQMNLYPEYTQQPYYGGVHGQFISLAARLSDRSSCAGETGKIILSSPSKGSLV